MELSERKQKILKAIVDLYIRSAEPVGSKTIAALPDMNFSSATIRNEMAELTTLGFLEQPHTSAGRIPSPAGYRFYIDRLMQDYRLSVDETQSINQAMESRMQELDKAMSQVGKLVSKLTNLPAYTMTAPAGEVTVRHFEIILADAGSFILVVMTSDENVKNRLIKLPLQFFHLAAHMFQLDSFLFQLFFQIAGLDFRCDQIVLHIIGFPVFGFHILFEGIDLAFCFEIVVCNVQCKQCVLRIHRQAVVSG